MKITISHPSETKPLYIHQVASLILGLVVILSFSCSEKSISQASQSSNSMKNTPTLSGDTVTISAVSGHQIGYGEFRLTNSNSQLLQAEVIAAELLHEDKVQTLTPLHFFPKSSTESVPAGIFEIPAQTTLEFMLSFPDIDANAHFRGETAVRLHLRVGGETLQANSIIVLERRIPLR